ncbi:MAG: metal-dependent hydrolase [Acidobacteriaceae bacterium]
MDLKGAKLTWLGHSTFLIENAGKRILIDPWVMSNPKTPDSCKQIPKIDLMLCTHGHGDHMGDAVEIAKKHQPIVIAMPEFCGWLTKKGVQNCSGMNKGGTQKLTELGVEVTMVDARHSSGVQDGDNIIYAGEPCGYVLTFSSGLNVYHAGDTCVFGDMAIIRELYAPQVALLPIGDHYTMGPKEAAHAAKLLQPKWLVPMHFGTFPVLTGSPALLKPLLPAGVEMVELNPGDTKD